MTVLNMDKESSNLDVYSSSSTEASDNEEIAENDTDNSDQDTDEEQISDNNEDNPTNTNAAWADSIAKILKTKKPKGKKTLVLSKAKKLTDVIKRKKPVDVGFQIDGEITEEKPDPSILSEIKEETSEPVRKKRKEIPSIRVKPNILDKDRERTFTKIATRGVVQLFNSVRMQQKDIDSKLEQAGPLERKRENVLKNIDKRAFLDVLMKKKSQPVDGNVKIEAKKEKESTWNVLRDDFMMGTKLKDWDKETEDNDDGDDYESLSESD